MITMTDKMSKNSHIASTSITAHLLTGREYLCHPDILQLVTVHLPQPHPGSIQLP